MVGIEQLQKELDMAMIFKYSETLYRSYVTVGIIYIVIGLALLIVFALRLCAPIPPLNYGLLVAGTLLILTAGAPLLAKGLKYRSVCYEVTEGGLTIVNRYGMHIVIPWKEIASVRETSKTLLLATPGGREVIHKNLKGFQEFYELFTRYAGGKIQGSPAKESVSPRSSPLAASPVPPRKETDEESASPKPGKTMPGSGDPSAREMIKDIFSDAPPRPKEDRPAEEKKFEIVFADDFFSPRVSEKPEKEEFSTRNVTRTEKPGSPSGAPGAAMDRGMPGKTSSSVPKGHSGSTQPSPPLQKPVPAKQGGTPPRSADEYEIKFSDDFFGEKRGPKRSGDDSVAPPIKGMGSAQVSPDYGKTRKIPESPSLPAPDARQKRAEPPDSSQLRRIPAAAEPSAMAPQVTPESETGEDVTVDSMLRKLIRKLRQLTGMRR